MSTLIVALRVTIVTLIVTGFLYPAAVTGIAKVLFSSAAEGALIRDDRGQVIGSAWIAQGFAKPGYFQPRPSAAGNGYEANNSGASNFGPTSQKLRERAQADAKRLAGDNPGAPGPVPAELVTASASGLDPHISPEAALWQLPRVAKSRRVEASRLRPLVDAMTEGRDLGFLGEPRVNVLLLNRAVDRLLGAPPPAP